MRRFSGNALVVATHNSGKLQEIAALLSEHPITVTCSADHGLTAPAETADSFVGNARIKALATVRATGLPALADDSGLEVEGLDGAPGVWTADWAETSHGRDFDVAMARVWQSLENAGTPEPRRARFCCALVLMWPDEQEAVFEGWVHGRIVWPGRGTSGHGYDPVFQPDGSDMTFAEMAASEKNRMSHRADAFAKLVAGCFV